MLIPSINNNLNELVDLLKQLSNSEYSKPYPSLSNSTIGEHIRHIIEMFQCLECNYDSGVVNYDNRQRNVLVQTDVDFAIIQINAIYSSLDKENKKIELQQIIDGEELRIESNYFRELLYNLEHCIHHQALIKVAVLQNAALIVDTNFGVARSTIEYRSTCAQ
ncbi:DinB family protein [Flavobacterium sp. K5-23]|uniref:DinB family protein n=1 Tax=Flavobacterium sp. K5-23 TaxID=2746225 RepID=UPI00200DC78B|nr:DinB family protein [Flavobacterium sp. K5-23]UQD56021.1 DinB family protein [Flavobacterium sp. K5-23]